MNDLYTCIIKLIIKYCFSVNYVHKTLNQSYYLLIEKYKVQKP